MNTRMRWLATTCSISRSKRPSSCLRQAKQNVEDKHRERRRLRETIRSTDDSAERLKLERQMDQHGTESAAFVTTVAQLRKLGLEVKRLEQEYEAAASRDHWRMRSNWWL